LATEQYAIPISQVKEIIRYSGATRLPNVAKWWSESSLLEVRL